MTGISPRKLPKLGMNKNSMVKDMIQDKGLPNFTKNCTTSRIMKSVDSSLNNSFELPNINDSSNNNFTGINTPRKRTSFSLDASRIKSDKKNDQLKGDIETANISKIENFSIKITTKLKGKGPCQDSTGNITIAGTDEIAEKDLKICSNLGNIHIMINSQETEPNSAVVTKRTNGIAEKSAFKKFNQKNVPKSPIKKIVIKSDKLDTESCHLRSLAHTPRNRQINMSSRSILQSGVTPRNKYKKEERANYENFSDDLPNLLQKMGIKDLTFYLYNYETEIARQETNMEIFVEKVSIIKKKIDTNIRAYLLGDFQEAMQSVEIINAPSMLVYSYIFYVSLLLEASNIQELFVVGKKLNMIAFQEQDNMANQYGHKTLGIACQKSSLFDDSLNHFHEMLKLALVTKNYDKEMDAYDLIGMSYYYLNDINKARYFHKKSISGEYETKDSRYRETSLNTNSSENVNGMQQGSNMNDKGGLLAQADLHDEKEYEINSPNVFMEKLKTVKKLGVTGQDGVFKSLASHNVGQEAKRYQMAKEAQEDVKNQVKKNFSKGASSMQRNKKVNTENSRAMYHYGLKPPKSDVSYGIMDRIGRKALSKTGGFKSSGETITRSFEFKKEVNRLYNKALKSKQILEDLKIVTMNLSESICTPFGWDKKNKSPPRRK